MSVAVELAYIPSPIFAQASAERVLFDEGFKVPKNRPLRTFGVLHGRKAEPVKGMRAVDERSLFLQYNFCRMKIALLPSDSPESGWWEGRMQDIRSFLVDQFLAQVIDQINKYNGIGDFEEAFSEGQMALLNAIDLFDVGKGNRFTTYLFYAVVNHLRKLQASGRKRHELIPVAFDEEFEAADVATDRHTQAEQFAMETMRRVLSQNLANLTPLERVVMRHRFPLDGSPRMTMDELAFHVAGCIEFHEGTSRQMLSQAEHSAMLKIRRAVEAHL